MIFANIKHGRILGKLSLENINIMISEKNNIHLGPLSL
jgi:hypothetical protein